MGPSGSRVMSVVLVVSCCAVTWAADRDVQIRSIDFASGIVELHNFGTVDEPLDGWRFCTHDDSEFRRYSNFSGFNGQTIEAGTSIFIHFANDAPADPDHFNSSALAPFALPLDNDAYAMQLYVNSGFGVGANIADHLQWSIDGVDNTTADERSDEAEVGGVWTDQSAWIPTMADTTEIRLKASSEGGTLHGPDDYDVLGASPGSGAVPDGDDVPGSPLVLDEAAGSTVTLTWDASCSATDTDYAVYQGVLGDLGSLASLTCTTGGLLTTTLEPSLESVFFLVVPTNGTDEGSYGRDSAGTERLPAASACHPASFATCPPPSRSGSR